MASLTQLCFAAPTPPPWFYAPLAPGGLAELDSARLGLTAAFGWVLQRITTASTLGFKWLTRGNFSCRRDYLTPTPTSGYYRGSTINATGNFSLAITVVSALAIFVFILFGAGLVYFRSFTSVLHQEAKNEKRSPKSLYSESPTLFYQDDTALPPASHMPRLSCFWVSALSFILRGLAFLFRLIHIEELLDMVEGKTTEQAAAVRSTSLSSFVSADFVQTSTTSHIAELRALDQRLRRAINSSTPSQTVSPARLPDVNKTLVAPLSPFHAKSNLGQVFPPSSDDNADILILPEGVKGSPCIEIDPTAARKEPVTDAVANIVGEISNPLAVGAKSVALLEGDKGTTPSLPTSNRRSPLRSSPLDPAVAPISVKPSGVPDLPLPTSSPAYNSRYKRFRPTHLTTGDRPSTPASVEPSGVPDRALATHEPLAESSAQAELRRIFQWFSPLRPRHPALVPGIASKPSTTTAELQQIPQPCFDDSRLQPKPTTLTSFVRPLVPPVAIETSHRKNASIKKKDCQNPPARKDILEGRPQVPRDRLASIRSRSDTEANPRLLISASQRGLATLTLFQMDINLQLTRRARDELLPGQSSTGGAKANAPQILTSKSPKGITATQDEPRDTLLHVTPDRSITDAGAELPLRRTRPPQKDPAIIQMDLRPQFLREKLAQETNRSSTGAKETPPRLPTTPSQKELADTQQIPKDVQSTGVRLASAGPSHYVEAARSPPNTPLRRTSKDRARSCATKTVSHLFEAVAAVQDRPRRTIERSREVTAPCDIRIREKYPARETQPGEQPRRPMALPASADLQGVHEGTPREIVKHAIEEIRQRRKDLFVRVQPTLTYWDERRELRSKQTAQEVDKNQTSPGGECPTIYPSFQISDSH
jgi:hypothetical protein